MSAQLPENTRVVFITGCSNGGIGSSLAAEFARSGCLVYASARSLGSLSDLDDNIRKLELDVTHDASCEQTVNAIYEATGRIDIFVSNAGISSIGALLDVSIETSQRIMDTNYFGTVRLVRLIGTRMALRGKGLIIPIGSTAGELPIPFKGHYNASKAALHSFTETLGEELRPFGVNVMLCAPGTVRSNIANNEAKNFERNLPQDSLYSGYKKQMNHVLFYGQNTSPMATDQFAKVFVRTAVSPHPPPYMTAGGTTTLWAFLKWLPRPKAIRMIWNSTVEKAK
ncbi:hypothetical protein GALMADRAFT_253091 [Galerina marginata CBS 339.88]|uniref:Uncharacterized protein n=1 Tax=Galerina marginata (strain CBS 339.88) TaxID=685588 RepID=A0A067SX31_GALM3|nr:hypothetical protein GALMADRAFT_253091 [Galerina marginata CBS 339.88]